MLPFRLIDRIESEKIRYLCVSYLEGLKKTLGNHFYLYIKEFHLEEKYLGITVGLLPKPTTIFISKYVDVGLLTQALPSMSNRVVMAIDPGNSRNPLRINKYTLYRLLSPVNHKHNLLTTVENINIELRNTMSSDTLVDTGYGGVEGIRVDPVTMVGLIV